MGGSVTISGDLYPFLSYMMMDALQCKLAAAPGGEELHKRYGVLATHRMEIERDLIKELVG